MPLLLPALLLVLSLVLPGHMFKEGTRPASIGLGPAAWPNAILAGLAVFSAIWLAREIWVLAGQGHKPSLTSPADADEYAYGKAVIGIGLVIAYGFFIPITGFTIATLAFLVIWCTYGGIRNPWILIAVSLIGTYVLLWVFMGLALMPLSRGTGIFDGISIRLLQILGIY